MNEKGHNQIFLNSRRKNLFRFGMEVLWHNKMRIFHLMYPRNQFDTKLTDGNI